ncbi:inosine-5'-monophosphate dehydrogenase [hydrocarbon metagenome]|uniref:HTH-type transcriptional regulatory protein TyrR n=1 Tax=hydrocarbon metagenome TaxID=938273 RepID=A0A0W8E912_9ZZZZ
MKLSEIMTTDLVVLTLEQTIREASQIFLDHQIDGAPVVNEKGKLLGLLTKSHIYRVLARDEDPQIMVGDVMKSDLIIGHPDDRVRDLLENNVGRLPVVDKRVVGMITRTDLARAYFDSFTSISNELSTILDSTHNLIISIDRDGKINVLNRIAEKFLGLKSTAVRGRDIMEIIPNSGLMEILETGISKPVQKIELNNCTFISNRTPIKKHGKIIGAVAVLQDISELESISRELENVKELNDEMDAIIESSHDGIYLTNGDGITMRLNEAFENLTGFQRSELIGRHVEDLVNEKGVVSASVSALVLKEKRPITIMQKTVTGKLALTTGTPIFDRKGKIFRVVSNVREITELMLLKQQLEQAQGLSKHYESELRSLQMQYSGSDKLIVSSRTMKDLLETVVRLAQVDSTVLITGESGTGKELIAETIHNNSARKNGPFIKINCGAISHNLLETELFGYEEGAFTGAKKGGKAGYFELASGGTLLLDEISELPFSLQVNLLRVIQNRELIRVGGERTIPIDVRILAASNRDIMEMVVKNEFREDLFYRLNVVPIEVPPLRDRKEEIPLLLAHFVQLFNKKYNMNKELSNNVIDVLMEHNWPGNVRELENIVERLVVTIPGNILSIEDLPIHLKNNTNQTKHPQISVSGIMPLREAVEVVEKQILEQACARYKLTREIAKQLNIDPSTVLRKAAKYGISLGDHSR